MAFDETLNNRIRESLSAVKRVEEKHMFGGTCYMVNGKMCLGVVGDEMMCRIDPDIYEASLEKPGCRPMDFTGKPMRGTQKQLQHWINLCLEFNKKAKASKKKKKRGL